VNTFVVQHFLAKKLCKVFNKALTNLLFSAILSLFILQMMIAPPSFFTPFRTMVDKPCFELGTCPPKLKQSEERRRRGKSELPLEKSNVKVVDNIHPPSFTRIGAGKCHRDYTSPPIRRAKGEKWFGVICTIDKWLQTSAPSDGMSW